MINTSDNGSFTYGVDGLTIKSGGATYLSSYPHVCTIDIDTLHQIRILLRCIQGGGDRSAAAQAWRVGGWRVVAGILFDFGVWLEHHLPVRFRAWVFIHITAPTMDRLK
jgi:hypothetical protein